MTTVTAATVADKVVDKTAAIADKAIDRAGDFVSAAADKASNVFEAASNIISHAVDTYGPQAVDAVLWVVRVDAIQYLVLGWVMFLMFLTSVIFVWTGFSNREWLERWDEMGEGRTLVTFILGVITLVVTIILGVNSIPRITNVWEYTAVAKPELYLAKQAVDIVKAKLQPALPQKAKQCR